MKNVIVIGTFLSHKKGTLSQGEKLTQLLNHNVVLVSKIENKYVRLVHIIFALLFKKYDIGIIEVFSDNAFLITRIASKIIKFRKKKSVFVLHGGRLNEFYYENLKTVAKVFKRCNHFVSPSKFLVEFFKEENFNVNYIPNFIEISKFKYKRDDIMPYSLLWVRAFSKYYNPELAIFTVARLIKDYPQVKLTMIGPDLGSLKSCLKLIKKLNVQDNISIKGKIDNNKLKISINHMMFLLIQHHMKVLVLQ